MHRPEEDGTKVHMTPGETGYNLQDVYTIFINACKSVVNICRETINLFFFRGLGVINFESWIGWGALTTMDNEIENKNEGFWRRVWLLYADGFRNMTIGKYLWAIIIFKLIVFFLIIKLIFFPDLLKSNYNNDADRAEAVREALTDRK